MYVFFVCKNMHTRNSHVYVYMYTYTCFPPKGHYVRTCEYLFIHLYKNTHMHIHLYIFACVHFFRVCMHVHIDVYYESVRTYMRMRVVSTVTCMLHPGIPLYIYAYMYIHMYTYRHSRSVYICMCVFIYIYIHTCPCIDICIYMYTHTFTMQAAKSINSMVKILPVQLNPKMLCCAGYVYL